MMESIQAAGERREHTPKMSAMLESHQNLLLNYVSMSERDKVLKTGSSWCALRRTVIDPCTYVELFTFKTNFSTCRFYVFLSVTELN